MVVPLNYYLALSVALFALGVIGVIIRRTPLFIFMSIEMMLNSTTWPSSPLLIFQGGGRADVRFFSLTVAAAEVAVAMALIVAIFRNRAPFTTRQPEYPQVVRRTHVRLCLADTHVSPHRLFD